MRSKDFTGEQINSFTIIKKITETKVPSYIGICECGETRSGSIQSFKNISGCHHLKSIDTISLESLDSDETDDNPKYNHEKKFEAISADINADDINPINTGFWAPASLVNALNKTEKVKVNQVSVYNMVLLKWRPEMSSDELIKSTGLCRERIRQIINKIYRKALFLGLIDFCPENLGYSDKIAYLYYIIGDRSYIFSDKIPDVMIKKGG